MTFNEHDKALLKAAIAAGLSFARVISRQDGTYAVITVGTATLPFHFYDDDCFIVYSHRIAEWTELRKAT